MTSRWPCAVLCCTLARPCIFGAPFDSGDGLLARVQGAPEGFGVLTGIPFAVAVRRTCLGPYLLEVAGPDRRAQGDLRDDAGVFTQGRGGTVLRAHGWVPLRASAAKHARSSGGPVVSLEVGITWQLSSYERTFVVPLAKGVQRPWGTGVIEYGAGQRRELLSAPRSDIVRRREPGHGGKRSPTEAVRHEAAGCDSQC